MSNSTTESNSTTTRNNCTHVFAPCRGACSSTANVQSAVGGFMQDVVAFATIVLTVAAVAVFCLSIGGGA